MLLHQGDHLTIQTGELRLTGEVVGCGADYLTLNTEHLCVDARLDRIVLEVSKRSSGGIEARGMAPTWRARLTELELTQEVVEVYAPLLGNTRRGRIRVAATDHSWLEDRAGFDFYLPIEEITAVIRPCPLVESPTAYPAASWVVVGLGQTGWDLM